MKRARDDAPEAPTGDNKRARANFQRRNDRNRPPQSTNGGRNGKAHVRTLKDEREEDPRRLAQRQKQIDFGKNTLGYDRYCAMVPKQERRKGEHPMTPDKTLLVSKKQFDHMISRWRQALHDYDPPELVERLRAAEQQAAEASSVGEAATTNSQDIQSTTENADIDPDLADLDPSNQSSTVGASSIYDAFNDDEGDAVDVDDDDDDLL